MCHLQEVVGDPQAMWQDIERCIQEFEDTGVHEQSTARSDNTPTKSTGNQTRARLRWAP